MPQPLHVVTGDLTASAATVDTHADQMRTRHAAADQKIEASNSGIPAGSAVALGAAVTKWQADTTALYSQLVGHGHSLRSGAHAYAQVDEHAGDEIDAAASRMPDLGL